MDEEKCLVQIPPNLVKGSLLTVVASLLAVELLPSVTAAVVGVVGAADLLLERGVVVGPPLVPHAPLLVITTVRFPHFDIPAKRPDAGFAHGD